MNDDKSTIIDLNSFNNKGQKGDDDFETWLANEAPFAPEDSTAGTLAEGSSAYTITSSSSMASMGSYCPSTTTFTIKDMPHFAVSKKKKLPLDLLHKWYPEQMREIDDD